MALQIGVSELISKKLIRPSSSTPPHLRHYKLSLLDQLITSWYIPIAFLYPNNAQNQPKCSSLCLETSLSKILSSYYPLAGRLIENLTIDCNDKGATFIEAQVNFPMSEVLKQPQNLHNVVFPEGLPWTSITQVMEEDISLLVAQLTHFECGAKALSFCMSHKIGDANSLSKFIQDWAALNYGDACSKPCPEFDVSSFLPPIEDPSIKLPSDGSLGPPRGPIITRKYTFDGSKIRELKSRAEAETGIHNPTRVEVVTALLFYCVYKAVASVAAANDVVAEYTANFFHTANLRYVMGPPLSPNSFGNLAQLCNFNAKVENVVSFGKFVSQVRRSKIQFQDKFKVVSAEELHMELHGAAEKVRMMTIAETKNDNIIDSYGCSSWCRFNWYNVDFGWGKPEVVSLAPGLHKNIIMLMDDKHGDGIEAMISLSQEVMPLFQEDPELLAFASSSC